MEFDLFSIAILTVAVPAAFALSAAAGFGGSLILVPVLMMTTGVKEGVALSALLLAANNLVKAYAYRKTLPLKSSALIAIAVMFGAALGAQLMIVAPESWVKGFVIVMFLATFALDFLPYGVTRKSWAGIMAFTAGATSGFSGMSGPLKGVAIRSLGLDRQYLVGAAAMVSLVGDATKAAVFNNAGLLSKEAWILAGILLPVMIISTYAGRYINHSIGEKGFMALFWTVILGYSARLVLN
ncbi:MAG: sulfite exporter TauE/SafE family protein [Gammaproteobacteria bacterium]|nr:sulfite exporter TauE/SafE family protein [Gammaproteobacteria bacterium]